MNLPGFRTALMALIGETSTSEDAVWLFIHVATDGLFELSNLYKATILELLEAMLRQGSLRLHMVC